jgi:hypothetical protein
VGLALAILGGLLWVAVWVLQGFAPVTPVRGASAEAAQRAQINQ